MRMQVGIKRAALAVAKNGAGNLGAGHVALVDAAAVLVAGDGFQFAQRLGHGRLMGGDERGAAADERLDRDGLGALNVAS